MVLKAIPEWVSDATLGLCAILPKNSLFQQRLNVNTFDAMCTLIDDLAVFSTSEITNNPRQLSINILDLANVVISFGARLQILDHLPCAALIEALRSTIQARAQLVDQHVLMGLFQFALDTEDETFIEAVLTGVSLADSVLVFAKVKSTLHRRFGIYMDSFRSE